jgi:hypothetical protein
MRQRQRTQFANARELSAAQDLKDLSRLATFNFLGSTIMPFCLSFLSLFSATPDHRCPTN